MSPYDIFWFPWGNLRGGGKNMDFFKGIFHAVLMSLPVWAVIVGVFVLVGCSTVSTKFACGYTDDGPRASVDTVLSDLDPIILSELSRLCATESE